MWQQQQQYQQYQVGPNKITLILHHGEEQTPLIVYRGTSEQAIQENIRELTNLYRFKCVNQQQQTIILSSNLPNNSHIYIQDPTVVEKEEEESDEPSLEEQTEYLKTKIHQVIDAKNVLNVLKSMLIVLEAPPPPKPPAEDSENTEEKAEDEHDAKPAADDDDANKEATETAEKQEEEEAVAATEDITEAASDEQKETKEETEDTQNEAEETEASEEKKEEEDPSIVKYDGKYKELIAQIEAKIDVLQQIIFKSNDLSEDLLPKKAEEEKEENKIETEAIEEKENESEDALLERLISKMKPDLQSQILQMQQLLQMQQTTMMAMLASGGNNGAVAAIGTLPISGIDAGVSGMLGAAAGGTPLPRISFGLSATQPQLAQSQTSIAQESKEEEKTVDRSSEYKQWFASSKLVEDDEYDTIAGFFPDKGVNVKSMEKIYSGSEEQFDAHTFHNKCDDAGATFCIIQSEHSHVFGGFTSKSWKDESGSSSGMWREDDDAFIFLLRHPKDDVLPERWKVLGNKKEKTIRCDKNYGPSFGYGYDIRICTECDQKKDSSSQLDNEDACFGAPQDDDFLTGEFYFLVTEYEVYKVTM